MTQDVERLKRPFARRPESSDYDVGYGKPPGGTRFKPGQSGNPRGRPKGSKNRPKPEPHERRLRAIVLEEAYRTVKVNDAERQVRLPWRDHKGLLEAAIKYKADWEEELEYRKVHGLSGPEPLPHPDDIVVNLRAGTVEFKGPLTKEEKVEWDKLRDWKKSWDEEIRYLTKDLKKNPNDQLRKELNQAKRIREKLAILIPD